METADYTDYELILKLKPAFLLLLCYVSIVYSSFDFEISKRKIYEKCLSVIFQTSKQSVKFSFLFSC